MKTLMVALFATFVLNSSALAGDGCRPGYSIAFLKNVRSQAIESTIAEVRGQGLFYLLQVEISSERNQGRRSAANTIHISGSVPASNQSSADLSALSAFINQGRATALCLRVDPNYYDHSIKLPAQFFLKIGQAPGIYEIDLVQPLPAM